MIASSIEELCCICYEKLISKTILDKCKHELCNKCVMILHISDEIKCPICRNISKLDKTIYNSQNEHIWPEEVKSDDEYDSSSSSEEENSMSEGETLDEMLSSLVSFEFREESKSDFTVKLVGECIHQTFDVKIFHITNHVKKFEIKDCLAKLVVDMNEFKNNIKIVKRWQSTKE